MEVQVQVAALIGVVLDGVETTLAIDAHPRGQQLVVAQHDIYHLGQHDRPFHRVDCQIDVGDLLNWTVTCVVRLLEVDVSESDSDRARMQVRRKVVLGFRVVVRWTVGLLGVIDVDGVRSGDGGDADVALVRIPEHRKTADYRCEEGGASPSDVEPQAFDADLE